jgi:hypothetical protein
MAPLIRAAGRLARYNPRMRPTLEDGLRALREATELAKTIRIDLTEDYLRLIAAVEALPQNQSGADKSWVSRAERAFRDVFAKARPVARNK